MPFSNPATIMKSPTNRSPQDSLAFYNGRWVATHDATLPLDDWGVLQGVMLVERIRTYQGKLFQLPRHIARLKDSVSAVGIDWQRWLNFDLAETCERIAASALESAGPQHDIGLVILATPGSVGSSEPTRIVHASELPWKRLAAWYRNGQTLVTSSIRNVPSECWPVHIKTRSRLHYYLADQQAAQHGPHAGAVMLGISNQVTETSFANVMMVNGHGEIIAPKRSDVLPGISLEIALSIAAELQIPVRFADISLEAFRNAQEIILTGTNGGIWGACSLDGIALPQPTESSVLARLQERWKDLVGGDFIEQACRLG
jgi:branched-chain amino acid aminotransferase